MTVKPPPLRTILVVVGIALLMLAAYAVPGCIRKWQGERAQTRVDRGQAQAGADTGSEAMNTFENMIGNAAETDRQVGASINAVHAAPEAQKGAVAVSEACKFKANRNKPQCQGAAK